MASSFSHVISPYVLYCQHCRVDQKDPEIEKKLELTQCTLHYKVLKDNIINNLEKVLVLSRENLRTQNSLLIVNMLLLHHLPVLQYFMLH